MSKGDQGEKASGSAALPAGEQGLPRMRWLSVGLVLLVIVGTFIVPLKFKDNWWISGPVHNAHTITDQEDGCKTCHQKPFEMVKDEACLQCHQTPLAHISDHDVLMEASADPAQSTALSMMKGEVADYRCASCHREHEEPTALVPEASGFCIDCHQDVTAFTADAHPALSPLKMNDGGGLKFDHEYHMGEVSRTGQGDGMNGGLACVDCHRLSTDNEHFEPVNMDRDFRACHALSMVGYDQERILPHAQPEEIVRVIEEYALASTVLAREQARKKVKKPKAYERQIPGKQSPVLPACRGSILSCATTAAQATLEEQFQSTGCITCHEVTQGDTAMGESASRDVGVGSLLGNAMIWQVSPVQVPHDWYQDARFNHKSHLAKGATDDESCLSCHAALTSKTSADVLMPDADNCFGCHDADKADAVQLSCTACHDYHRLTESHALFEQTDLFDQAGSE